MSHFDCIKGNTLLLEYWIVTTDCYYLFCTDVNVEIQFSSSSSSSSPLQVTLQLLDLYSDDLAIIQENDRKLQLSVHKLYQLSKSCGVSISCCEPKVMALCGRASVRWKPIVDDGITEQVSSCQAFIIFCQG